ncbi:MAG: hypothetical protein R2722_04855 [Tessaracoccus sp.]
MVRKQHRLSPLALPTTPANTAAAITGYTQALEGALRASDSELTALIAGETLSAHLSPSLSAELIAAVPMLTDAVQTAPEPASPARKRADVDRGRQITAQLSKALAAATEVTDAVLLAEIAKLATSVEAATGRAAEHQLTRLMVAVNEGVRRSHAQAVLAQRAEEAVLGLPATPRAQQLRSEASTIGSKNQLIAFEAAVQAYREELAQAADDAYVAATTAAVLTEMGYSVELLDDDSLVSTPGALLRATRNDLPQHALQVRMLAESDTLVTNVVALGRTTAAQDAAAETLTCHDALSLPDRMAQHGVQVDRRFAHPVGKIPVTRAAEKRTSATPQRRRQTTTQAREAQA